MSKEPLDRPDSDGWWWCRKKKKDNYLPGDELCVEVTLANEFTTAFVHWRGENWNIEWDSWSDMEWIKASSPWSSNCAGQSVAIVPEERLDVEAVRQAVEAVENAALAVQDWNGTELGDALDNIRKAVGLPIFKNPLS
jgi:hypothetical protein